MERPNILLITTDQQRFDTINALGNKEIFTPHLNWLVDEGIAFTRCYSACPVCMPARATIMTGKEACTHELIGNNNDHYPMRDNVTFPKLLTENGYQTRAEGKLHFHPMRANYGIEHADLPMDYFNEMRKRGKISTRSHGIGENEVEPVINTIPETDTLTHWTVDKSMDFIENKDPTRPFFLWTSFTKPHPPFDPCLSYWELYNGIELSEPVKGDWSADMESAPLGFYKPTFALNNIWRMSKEQKKQVKRAYYACISQIDYNLGLLFAKMRELNLLENTWIIFTSDHGDLLGDHNMGAKTNFLEGSSHIPLLIKPPATFGHSHPAFAGMKCNKIVTLADIMPTILSICGISYDGDLDGIDLLSYLKHEGEKEFYGNCENKYFAVIENQYKYMWTWYGGEELMFDLDKDPKEQNDLAKLSQYSSIKEKLHFKMTENMKKTSPQLVYDNKPVAGKKIESHHEISRFPGYNTTLFPRDTFH